MMEVVEVSEKKSNENSSTLKMFLPLQMENKKWRLVLIAQ